MHHVLATAINPVRNTRGSGYIAGEPTGALSVGLDVCRGIEGDPTVWPEPAPTPLGRARGSLLLQEPGRPWTPCRPASPSSQNAESQGRVSPRALPPQALDFVLRDMGPEGRVCVSDQLRSKADTNDFLLSGRHSCLG